MGRRLVISLSIALVCCPAMAARAWIVHIDRTITDPHGIRRAGNLRTVVQDANDPLLPGDTVVIESGIHQIDQFTWPRGKSGTDTAPIVIIGQGDPNYPDKPTFRAELPDDYWMEFQDNAYIELRNLHVDNVRVPIRIPSKSGIDGAHHLTFSNLLLTHCGLVGVDGAGRAIQMSEQPGLPRQPQHDIRILNTEIRDVSEVGIKINGRAHHVLIENVTIDNVICDQDQEDGDGITLNGQDGFGAPSDITIRNVRVWLVSEDGIDLKAHSVVLDHCDVRYCRANGLKLWSPIVDGVSCHASYQLRHVDVSDVNDVACEAFYMPDIDMEQCSFRGGAEQGFYYRWGELLDQPVPAEGWTARLRSYRNLFWATRPDVSACLIVTRHQVQGGAGVAAVSFAPYDCHSPGDGLNNDAFWSRDPNRPCDPNDPNACDPNGLLLRVCRFDQGAYTVGNVYRKQQVLAALVYRQEAMEHTAIVRGIKPDFSPPPDFNLDGRVTGWDFLMLQAHYPMAAGACKPLGDADGDGAITGSDYVLWQSWYPYFPPPETKGTGCFSVDLDKILP